MELGKVPPHDTEAEQAVIGSMFTDKDAIISAIEILKEDDFILMMNEISYELDVLDGKLETIEISDVLHEMGFPVNYKDIVRVN